MKKQLIYLILLPLVFSSCNLSNYETKTVELKIHEIEISIPKQFDFTSFNLIYNHYKYNVRLDFLNKELFEFYNYMRYLNTNMEYFTDDRSIENTITVFYEQHESISDLNYHTVLKYASEDFTKFLNKEVLNFKTIEEKFEINDHNCQIAKIKHQVSFKDKIKYITFYVASGKKRTLKIALVQDTELDMENEMMDLYLE